MRIQSFIAACAVTFLMASGYAQLATTTALVGTVSDSSGQVIPAVKITATNTGTGESYNIASNDQGYYSIQFVRPGTYNLILEKSGFEKFQKTGIEVAENQIVLRKLRNDEHFQPAVMLHPVRERVADDANVVARLQFKGCGRDPARPQQSQGQKETRQ